MKYLLQLQFASFCWLGWASANAEDPIDYWAAALANAEAIHNYDCLVKSEIVFIPTEEIAEDYGGYTEELVERVVLDLDQQVCFYVSHQKYIADDSKKPPPAKVQLPFERTRGSMFINERPFLTNGRRNYQSFEEHLTKERIPRMDLACANGHPYHFPEATKQEHIAEQMQNDSDSSLAIQPNGDVLCSFDQSIGRFYDRMLFDPNRLVVKKFVRQQKNDSGLYAPNAVGVERRYQYEEANGIYRLVQMDFEEEPMVHKKFRKIGTTTIEWLQFNSEALVFPTEEAVKRQQGRLGYFLDEQIEDMELRTTE